MNKYRLSHYASAAQNGIGRNTKVTIDGLLSVSIDSLFGSVIAIAIIDCIPRKKILAWSFLLLAALLLITGGLFLQFHGTRHSTVIIVLYALCQAIFNLSKQNPCPRTVGSRLILLTLNRARYTYLRPPCRNLSTRYHCTCHGIPAAAGELGSMLIQAILYAQHMDNFSKDSKCLGNVLIGFSFVIAIGFLFARAWIPDAQRPGLRRGRRVLVSMKLEELARGKRRAEEDGQIIEFRENSGDF
jgi:PHS family inorganic phosphate transporter-like MFS transporter